MKAKMYSQSSGKKELVATVTLLNNGAAKIETQYELLQDSLESGFKDNDNKLITPDNGKKFINQLPIFYDGTYMKVEIE